MQSPHRTNTLVMLQFVKECRKMYAESVDFQGVFMLVHVNFMRVFVHFEVSVCMPVVSWKTLCFYFVGESETGGSACPVSSISILSLCFALLNHIL